MTAVLLRTRKRDVHVLLRDVLLGVGVLGIVVVCCAAFSIALDIHFMRRDRIVATTELRNGLFSRLDAFLWKVDTALTIESEMSKSLSRGLMQVQVQVKQSSDEQKKTLQTTSNTTRAVVKDTLEAASQVMVTAAATQPSVTVEAAKVLAAAAPSVTVNPILSQPEPPKSSPVAGEPKKSKWRWLRFLWPCHHDAGSK